MARARRMLEIGRRVTTTYAPGGLSAPGALIENADVLRAGPGSNSVDVGEIQGLLNFWGARPQLEVDNAYGPLTTQAVRDFQQANGLTVDGVVGPQTSNALQDDTSKSVGAKVSPTKTTSTLKKVLIGGAVVGGTVLAARAVNKARKRKKKE